MKRPSNISNGLITEALHILVASILVLIYLYALDLFQPSYLILLRGVVWSNAFRLGLLDLGFYGALSFTVSFFALGICVHLAGGLMTLKPSKLARYILVSLITLITLPLLYWMTYMWSPQLTSNYRLGPFRWVSEFDAMLLNTYAPIYPLLLLVALYAWLGPVFSRAIGRRIRLTIKYSGALNTSVDYGQSNNTLIKRLSLAFAILLSITLPLIPYLPAVNPGFEPASVDIRFYRSWLESMLMTDPWNAVKYAFYGSENGSWNGNRPLYLLLLYCLTKLGLPKQAVLNLEALYIAPSFALAVYFACKKLFRNSPYASLSSLAGVLGFNMTVNVFGGFFASWTAMTLFYLCIALIPSLEEGDVKGTVSCVLLSTAMLYTHPWTWSLFMAALTVYLATVTLRSKPLKDSLKTNKHILILLTANVLVDLLKSLLTPSYGGLEGSTSYALNTGFGLDHLTNTLRDLHRMTTTFLGGLLYNPLHVILALIGTLSLTKRRDKHSTLILTWIIVISAVFLIGKLGVKARLLLASPFPILIVEGLWTISKLLAKFDSKLPKLLIAFFIVSSLTYTVRALCNLI